MVKCRMLNVQRSDESFYWPSLTSIFTDLSLGYRILNPKKIHNDEKNWLSVLQVLGKNTSHTSSLSSKHKLRLHRRP